MKLRFLMGMKTENQDIYKVQNSSKIQYEIAFTKLFTVIQRELLAYLQLFQN